MRKARVIYGPDLQALKPDWFSEFDHGVDCRSYLVEVETDESQPPEYPRQPYCGLRAGEVIIEEIGQDGGEPEDQSLSRDWEWVVHMADREMALKAENENLKAVIETMREQHVAATAKLEVMRGFFEDEIRLCAGPYASDQDSALNGERILLCHNGLRLLEK